MSLTSRELADRLLAGATEAGADLERAVQEGERLAALDRIGLCDTPAAESFDRVTRLAARALDVPIALVSLVAETRQWFKSKIGLDVTQTSRQVSFCAHAVVGRAPLIVPDAMLDARFADNPLVTGEPGIRAYAGIPLQTSDGHAIGTLCVIDRRPRVFSAADIDTLRDFAAIAQDLVQGMELAADNERALYLATERETLYRELFEHAGVGIVLASLSGRLLRANPHMLALLGCQAERIGALSFADITHPADIPATAAMIDQVRDGAVESGRLEKRYLRRDGTHFWGQVTLVLRRSAAGTPRYLIAAIEDISARKQQTDEQEHLRDTLQAQVARQASELAGSHEALHGHVIRVYDAELAARQFEHRLRVIGNCVPSMIGYWNRDLCCEFANEAFREWFGLAPEQISGMSLEDLLGGEFEHLRPYVRLALQGAAQRFERGIRTLAGVKALMEVRLHPDFDESSAVLGLFVQMTDVTAR
jgi:PAS domain S-box-containing protein